MIEVVIAFFAGWMIGADIREKRIRKEIERKAQASVNLMHKQLAKYDVDFTKAMWIGKKEYLDIMIRTSQSGISIEQMKYIFEQQMEYVEQELAIENTKEILL